MKNRSRAARKISLLPTIKGLKPYGENKLPIDSTPIILLLEEYESIRLCDYEMKNHQQASLEMEVSRPTFTRIYASALKKIAKVMIEGRPLSIEGGKVYFDSDWYKCNTCSCIFSNPDKIKKVEYCSLCSSSNILLY